MDFIHNMLGKINGKVLMIVAGVILAIAIVCVIAMFVTA